MPPPQTSPSNKTLRIVLLSIVVCLIVAGFWWYMTDARSQSAVSTGPQSFTVSNQYQAASASTTAYVHIPPQNLAPLPPLHPYNPLNKK